MITIKENCVYHLEVQFRYVRDTVASVSAQTRPGRLRPVYPPCGLTVMPAPHPPSRIQHEVVSGLKYTQAVYRKGVRVDRDSHMLGSYGPKPETQTAKTPPEQVGRHCRPDSCRWLAVGL